MKKTKSVDGKQYSAKSFAYVGDPSDPSTWELPVFDASHTQDALSRFDQAQIPSDAKAKTAKKLVAAAKRFGIDASGFAKEYVTKQADMSFDDIECELQDELLEEFGSDSFGDPLYFLVQAFPDYLIARGPGAKLYRISYTIDDQDEAALGDPQEVETAFVPVSESGIFMAAESGVAVDDWVYPVQVMKTGWANGAIDDKKNVPHYVTPALVAEVAAAVNGAKFGRQHPPAGSTGSEQPDRIAGWLENGKLVGEAAMGDVHLLKSETKLQQKLSAARSAGKLDLFGVSMLGFIKFKAGKVQGKDCLVGESLGKLISVDLCAEAGAGGKFLQYAASKAVLAEISQMQKESLVKASENHGSANDAGRKIGALMKERIKKLLDSLRKHDA